MSDELEPSEDGARTHERDRPRGRRVAIAVVPAVVLVVLIGVGFLIPRDPSPEPPASGSRPFPRAPQVPDFELELLEGGTVSSDELRGRPVVLNFWASWCGPCREEMPAFERMWTRYRDDGIQIIGVNVQDSEAGAREFAEEVGVTYPIALDHSDELSGPLGVRGLPQTFFIDGSFRFEKISAEEAVNDGGGDRVVFGAIDEETLEQRILELLEGDP